MISLEYAKAHLRVEIDEDDDLISSMISAATAYVQRRIGWYLGEQKEIAKRAVGMGTHTLWLPQPPTDDSVTVDGEYQGPWIVDGARILRTDGMGWVPAQLYEVEYQAGYAPDEGPEDLRQAVAMIVASWYEHREGYAAERGLAVEVIPDGVSALLARYERWRV